MFEKILIANRGEIACRIIRTARSMGVATVAVYSDADATALHVALVDEAMHIGGSRPADSYLRGDAIIWAALASGAQAVHPGYGFLSENPDFAEAVGAAGLVFVGPSPTAIRAMGLKDAAKAQMEKAGVPVVPGYHGKNQKPAHLKTQAGKIGYPVMIKAIAGGGGKGMRLVENAGQFADALKSARTEARAAFGDDRVLIEKYIEKSRHIEVQIFGDGKRAVHLFERDCSLQRRHQKVIEEAPAPGMTDGMRAAMGAAAVRAAEAIGYCGAGTVEFIVDAENGLRDDGYWFMEMNTRLQVEHPVTEAVTGVDLVEWQLRVAAGEPLPAMQDQLQLQGHSFEARIYAEDAANGFLPQTGTLEHLKFPDAVRAEAGVRAGDEISPFYDPMIAKIVVHGPTRDVALGRLRLALSGTEVAGTITNLAFLERLSRDQEFARGNMDTGLIDRNLAALTADDDAPPDEISAHAAICAYGLDGGCGELAGFTLWSPLRRRVIVSSSGRDFTVILEVIDGNNIFATLDGEAMQFRRVDEFWLVDGRKIAARLLKTGNSVHVFARKSWVFEIPDDLAPETSQVTHPDVILAPMPGLVSQVFVKLGQQVAAGDRLAILEAMKMEHTLTAPCSGKIAEILTKPGSQVEAGAPVVRLEMLE